MDNGAEWQGNDSSKFIFHYNLEYVHSSGDEKKITIEKWMPLSLFSSAPSATKATTMMNAFLYIFEKWKNGNQTAIKQFERWERKAF